MVIREPESEEKRGGRVRARGDGFAPTLELCAELALWSRNIVLSVESCTRSLGLHRASDPVVETAYQLVSAVLPRSDRRGMPRAASLALREIVRDPLTDVVLLMRSRRANDSPLSHLTTHSGRRQPDRLREVRGSEPVRQRRRLK